jgi:hypothetical protein
VEVDLGTYTLDGGYYSFKDHTDVWYKLEAKPVIAYSSDSKVHNKRRMK